jgi:hypothetical protein
LAAGSLIGTWGDALTTLGLPSAWACRLSEWEASDL